MVASEPLLRSPLAMNIDNGDGAAPSQEARRYRQGVSRMEII
jgi:hypothetical protein